MAKRKPTAKTSFDYDYLITKLNNAKIEEEVVTAYQNHFGLEGDKRDHHDFYTEQVLYEFKLDEPLAEADPVFPKLDRISVLDKYVPPSAFDSSPPGGLVKSNAAPQSLTAANLRRVASLDKRDCVFVFPDGSAEGNCTAGIIAGGVCVTRNGIEIARWKGEFGGYGCSYTAEIRTIEMTLEELIRNADEMRNSINQMNSKFLESFQELTQIKEFNNIPFIPSN